MTVDDSTSIRIIVTEVLRNGGYEVREAENGAEALDLLKANSVDLVLCDVNMPVMDGYGFVQAVRADPDLVALPIVLVTTEYTDEAIARGREAGATGWIVKPFEPEDLLHVVQRLLS